MKRRISKRTQALLVMHSRNLQYAQSLVNRRSDEYPNYMISQCTIAHHFICTALIRIKCIIDGTVPSFSCTALKLDTNIPGLCLIMYVIAHATVVAFASAVPWLM